MIWFFDHILMWSAMIKSQNDLVSIRSPKLWRFYKINDSALKFVESTKWIEFLKCKKSQCWKSFFKTSNAKCIVCKCIKSKCSTTWCIIQLFIKIQWKISIIYWHNYHNKKVIKMLWAHRIKICLKIVTKQYLQMQVSKTTRKSS